MHIPRKLLGWRTATALERLWHVVFGQSSVLPLRPSLHAHIPAWADQTAAERLTEGDALTLRTEAYM